MSDLRVTNLRGRTVGSVPTLPDGAVVGTAITMYASSGIVSATAFYGDGSGLIGVASTDNIVTGTAATFNNTVNINATLDVTGHAETDTLRVSGVSTFQGNVDLLDDDRLRFGDANDFYIMHDSNDNITKIKEDGGTLRISANEIQLQHNDVGIATITNHGIQVSGIVSTTNLQVSGMVTATSGLRIPGGTGVSNRIELGNSQELTVQYNTSSTRGLISAASNAIDIQATTIKLLPNAGENGVIVNQNGSVDLYHDNAKKFETTDTGAVVTGILTATTIKKSGGTSTQYLMADGTTTEGDSVSKGYIAGLSAFLN